MIKAIKNLERDWKRNIWSFYDHILYFEGLCDFTNEAKVTRIHGPFWGKIKELDGLAGSLYLQRKAFEEVGFSKEVYDGTVGYVP